jgi:hypothetical protein
MFVLVTLSTQQGKTSFSGMLMFQKFGRMQATKRVYKNFLAGEEHFDYLLKDIFESHYRFV